MKLEKREHLFLMTMAEFPEGTPIALLWLYLFSGVWSASVRIGCAASVGHREGLKPTGVMWTEKEF